MTHAQQSGFVIDAWRELWVLLSQCCFASVLQDASADSARKTRDSPPDRSPATHRLRRFPDLAPDSQSAVKIRAFAGCHARAGAEEGAGNAYI